MVKSFLCLALVLLLFACSKNENTAVATITPIPTPIESMYFPPLSSTIWETKAITDLGWKQSAVQPLLDFLNLKNSKSFIVVVNGKIVLENYFNGHSTSLPWYWASAGKTLTSTVVGIAQQEGLLNINNKVATYIGAAWTSETLAQENLITCKNLLTMTSGLDDVNDAVDPANLIYKEVAGNRWAYHNVYVKLQDVVAQASGQTWENYFDVKLKNKIGMTGSWIASGNNQIFWSNTRSMARFGLLMLNNGKWENNQILNENYCNEATNTSQSINQSYGYLWWLNGKTSYHLPSNQATYLGSLIPSGPTDMFMALGKNDQKIYIIPSKKMVVVRMGDAADGTNVASSQFDEMLWQKINGLF